jgi:hypothetical protein
MRVSLPAGRALGRLTRNRDPVKPTVGGRITPCSGLHLRSRAAQARTAPPRGAAKCRPTRKGALVLPRRCWIRWRRPRSLSKQGDLARGIAQRCSPQNGHVKVGVARVNGPGVRFYYAPLTSDYAVSWTTRLHEPHRYLHRGCVGRRSRRGRGRGAHSSDSHPRGRVEPRGLSLRRLPRPGG